MDRLQFRPKEQELSIDELERIFWEKATESGRYDEILQSGDFPTEPIGDIRTVLGESHRYLGPLVATFVKSATNQFPGAHFYCPLRSGQIYAKAADAMGIPGFTTFGYPRVIRDPTRTYTKDLAEAWYGENPAMRRVIDDHSQKSVIIDWGCGGSLPHALDRLRAAEFKRKYHKYMPENWGIQSYFLFSSTLSDRRFSRHFIAELPDYDTLDHAEEMAVYDPRMRGLLNLTETTHDCLRGATEKVIDDFDARAQRNPHPNPVIWALNTAAEIGVLEWCARNKKVDISGPDAKERAIGWASDFSLEDFARYTFRGWKNERVKIPLLE